MSNSRSDQVPVRLNRWHTPTEFRWQGAVYRIEQIDRIWRHSQGEARGQRLYRVHARGRVFLLRHERSRDRWTLVRSSLRVRLGLSLTRLVLRLTV